jgi:hypothetical protein
MCNNIFITFKKLNRLKRDTETSLKTRRFLTRWRFQTRKKTRFHTPFLKTRVDISCYISVIYHHDNSWHITVRNRLFRGAIYHDMSL